MTFIEKVLKLLERNGITKNKMLIDLSLSKNSFVDWKKRGNVPNGDVIGKIADYFNVSTDYLLGKAEPDEITFDDFTYARHNESKNLTEEDKRALLAMAKIFKDRLDKER